MKKTLTALAMLLLVLLLGSVFLLTVSPHSETKTTSTKHHSQSDITPDLSSPKAYYDFALSSLGENDLEQITNAVQSIEQSDIPTHLFQTYLDYKKALGDLITPNGLTIKATDLEQLHLQLLELQSQHFTPFEAELLFAEENTLRQLAIEKALLSESGLSDSDKAAVLEQYIDTLPDYIKTTEQNNNLVADLISMDGLDEQQKRIVRTELVGENGAQRLAQLDQQRAQFQHTFDSYLEKRATLLGSDQLSDQQKQQQVSALREETFPSSQIRRIQALERIHDAH